MITASVVVQFGEASAAEAVLMAEVDGRDEGLNPGSTFVAGDSVYLLVHAYLVTDIAAVCSAGSIGFISRGVRSVTEQVAFADSIEASVHYPVDAITDVVWVGTDLGAVVSVGGTGVRSGVKGVGILEITYNTAYEVWRLNAPSSINGKTIFDILSVFTGE